MPGLPKAGRTIAKQLVKVPGDGITRRCPTPTQHIINTIERSASIMVRERKAK